MRRTLLRCVLLASIVACGGAQATPTRAPAGASGFEIERLFPLEDGKIYSYVTKEGGDTGMVVAKVHRSDPLHGELRTSNTNKRFTIAAEGIAYEGGAFILKAPIELGTSWPGEHGGTTKVTAVDLAVEVPAGHYTSCVRTLEEGGRVPGGTYETTYCPGVGMVLLVVSAGGSEARAELKSYGAPVKIE